MTDFEKAGILMEMAVKNDYISIEYKISSEMRSVNGGEKPDQRAEQNTATAAFGVRWSEGVGMR